MAALAAVTLPCTDKIAALAAVILALAAAIELFTGVRFGAELMNEPSSKKTVCTLVSPTTTRFWPTLRLLPIVSWPSMIWLPVTVKLATLPQL